MQRFEVPIKFVSLNEYIDLCKKRKGNYNPAQNYKHKVQNEIVMHIKKQRVKTIRKPVRLRFIWYEATKRRDKDNVAFGKKFLLDGMQSAGILPSDNNQWIAGFAGEDFVYGEGQKVVVEIYECDEAYGTGRSAGDVAEVRAAAIKEFAEKLITNIKEHYERTAHGYSIAGWNYSVSDIEVFVHNLVKDMESRQ